MRGKAEVAVPAALPVPETRTVSHCGCKATLNKPSKLGFHFCRHLALQFHCYTPTNSQSFRKVTKRLHSLSPPPSRVPSDTVKGRLVSRLTALENKRKHNVTGRPLTRIGWLRPVDERAAASRRKANRTSSHSVCLGTDRNLHRRRSLTNALKWPRTRHHHHHHQLPTSLPLSDMFESSHLAYTHINRLQCGMHGVVEGGWTLAFIADDHRDDTNDTVWWISLSVWNRAAACLLWPIAAERARVNLLRDRRRLTISAFARDHDDLLTQVRWPTVSYFK